MGVTCHFDGGVGEIDEARDDLALLAGGVERGRIPERQHRTDKLAKAFGPSSIWVGPALCMNG